jgi:phage-related protein
VSAVTAMWVIMWMRPGIATKMGFVLYVNTNHLQRWLSLNLLTALIQAIPLIFGSIWAAIKGVFNGVGEWFGEKFTAAKEKISEAWSNIKEWFAEKWQGIKDAFSNVGGWFKEKFNGAKEKATEAWSNAKEKFSNTWSNIKGAFSNVGGWFKDQFKQGKENATTAWSNVKQGFSTAWTNIKSAFSNTGTWFKDTFAKAKDGSVNAWSNIKSKFTSIKDKVTSAFSNIKEKLSEPFTKAKEKISDIADKIKGFFKGEISMPKIKLPHFSLSPSGWKIGDLLEGSIPKLSIKWYAEAMRKPMIMNKPTVFGYDAGTGKLLGGGEAGSEVVSGTSTLMRMIQTAVSSQNSALAYYLQKIIEILADYFPQVLDEMNKVPVWDTGVAAVQLAPAMNVQLGIIKAKEERGR